jgi:alpha-glucosidase
MEGALQPLTPDMKTGDPTVTVTAASVPSTADRPEHTWWRDAVVYQVYIRSFADGTGDGVGDIAGLRSKLDYLARLGVDAIWINPWYPSPMADAGYDVADYRDIEPVFGDLAQAEALLREAHARGLRVMLDIVPNHASDQHAWFQAALAAGPGSPERARFIFRDGGGEHGELPPNDWRSVFGGPAWTQVPDGQWYLHLFAPGQPDLDWTNPDVHADFQETLRFWFDRGVDGFRIDVAHGLAKAEGLPDVGPDSWTLNGQQPEDHPHWDVDTVHDIYREWRAVADEYDPPRVFVAEAWIKRLERLVRYLRPDELHTAFNFDFLVAAWRADAMRRALDSTLEAHRTVGAPPTWVLSNHDVLREVSRYARPQDVRDLRNLDSALGLPVDLERGQQRARAAALLMLALPGGAYVYQGGELGLPEVEDLPEEALQDPVFRQTGGAHRGRDGCRVPLPWSGDRPPYGFGGAETWLPQPEGWAPLTAAAQERNPHSMLHLYRAALRLRRDLPALGDGDLRWLPTEEGALAFARDPGFGCLVTFDVSSPVELPAGARVLLASGPLADDGRVPADTAVWFAR